MSDQVCRKCNSPVKFANASLCEDCLLDPAVSPSIDEHPQPTFMRAIVERRLNAIDHLRPEQFDSRRNIAEEE